MKPAPFTYHRPRSLDEALAVLAEVGDHGKVLAGGQSLIPLLSMRLAAPEHLVDVNAVPGLDAVEVTGTGVRVGALVRHADLLRDDGAYAALPVLRQALELVAHPAVRNRGTTLGSICHADPSGEMPAVLALVEGAVEAASASGTRTIPAADLFVGPLETSLRPDELAVAVVFPRLPERTGTAVLELARRSGDYAMAGVAARVTLAPDGTVADARTAYLSAGDVPPVLRFDDGIAGRSPSALGWNAAAAVARTELTFDDDIHATAAYRRHLAGVLTVRALTAAAHEAEALDREAVRG